MTELPRLKTQDLDGILLLVLLAAAGRAGYVWLYADAAKNSGPFQVQDKRPTLKALREAAIQLSPDKPNELVALADEMKERQTFQGSAPFDTDTDKKPTAHTTPGYPGLLALVEMVPLDKDSLASAVRWLQC